VTEVNGVFLNTTSRSETLVVGGEKRRNLETQGSKTSWKDELDCFHGKRKDEGEQKDSLGDKKKKGSRHTKAVGWLAGEIAKVTKNGINRGGVLVKKTKLNNKMSWKVGVGVKVETN